jgi:hypothetical protein
MQNRKTSQQRSIMRPATRSCPRFGVAEPVDQTFLQFMDELMIFMVT